MPEFLYSARNEQGQRFSGTLEAPTREAALAQLSEKYPLVTRLEPASKGGWLERLGLGRRVSGEDLLGFTYQIAAMLRAGINLKRTLDLAVEESPPELRRAVVDVSGRISSGASLSSALREHPRLFDRFYCSMVEAGEAGGKLPELLSRLAQHIEQSETLRRKVQAALYYPLFVAAFAVVVVTGIILFGVPRVESLYLGLGAELPLPTKILMGFSKFVVKTWYVWLGVLISVSLLFRRLLGTEAGGLWFDGLKLRLPGLGDLFRTLATARFARTFGTLHVSGVPILMALDLTASSVGNRVMEKAVRDAVGPVTAGNDLAPALRKAEIFPSMALGMVASGEETGQLDTMLLSLADYYDIQTSIRLQAVASLVEPAVMVFVGLAVAVIIVAMALPFMNIASALT